MYKLYFMCSFIEKVSCAIHMVLLEGLSVLSINLISMFGFYSGLFSFVVSLYKSDLRNAHFLLQKN